MHHAAAPIMALGLVLGVALGVFDVSMLYQAPSVVIETAFFSVRDSVPRLPCKGRVQYTHHQVIVCARLQGRVSGRLSTLSYLGLVAQRPKVVTLASDVSAYLS